MYKLYYFSSGVLNKLLHTEKTFSSLEAISEYFDKKAPKWVLNMLECHQIVICYKDNAKWEIVKVINPPK